MTSPAPEADRGFVEHLGIRDRTADDGRARLTMEATADHLNQAGTVHGGLLATLADTVMGQAVRSLSDEGDTPATSQLTVTYLRPGSSGPLVARAEVRKQGESVTVCEAEVSQDDVPLVHAVATFAVLHG